MVSLIHLVGCGGTTGGQQFPSIEDDLPKTARYTSLWATKDVKRIRETKVFWVLMEVSIQMWIN